MEAKLDSELKEFRALQDEFSKIGNSKAKFLTQLNENEMVKKELELLDADSEVYKLIGPVLVKQEKSEALSNINKRLEFINGEIKRVDNTLKDIEKKQEEKKRKVIEIQQAMQQRSK